MSQSSEGERVRGRLVFQVLISCDTRHEAQPLGKPFTTNAIKKPATLHPLGQTGTQIDNKSQEDTDGAPKKFQILTLQPHRLSW